MSATSTEEEGVLALLRKVEALAALDDAVLKSVAHHATPQWIEPGTVLVREGDPFDALWLVSEGTIELKMRTPGGEATVDVLGPGRAIGIVQMLTGGLRTETAVATERSKLYRVGRAVYHGYAEAHPEAALRINELVRTRMRTIQLAALLPGLLGPVDATIRADVVGQVRWVEMRRGQVLYEAGSAPDGLYVVVSGRMRVDRGTEGVQEIGRGDTLGEISLLAGMPRTSTVTALRDGLLAFLPTEAFDALMQRRPEVAIGLARDIARRVSRSDTRAAATRTCQHLAFLPLGAAPVRPFVDALARHLEKIGPTLVLDPAALAHHGVIEGAERLDEKHPSWMRFNAWLDRTETAHRFILYAGDPAARGWTARCVDHADQVVLVADSDAVPDRSRADAFLPPDAPPTVLVLRHPSGTKHPSGTRRWLDATGATRHFHLRPDDPADEARVARLLAGRATGLTLGGGGARGLAHIGVIKAMRELGIPIDHVGGTSMGSIISAQYAMGLGPDEMIDLNRRLATLKPFKEYTLPFIALLRTSRIEQTARIAFGDTEIEDLWLPWFAVSANLTSAAMEIHDRGPVWVATRASGSLPGVVVPVLLTRQLLVDGGILNNIPGDVMRTRAGGRIVAVDVSPKVDDRFTIERLPTSWTYLFDRINPFRRLYSGPNIVDILLRTTMLSSSRHAERIVREVDVVLRPPVQSFGLLDFERIDAIVDAGYRHALEKLAGWTP